MSDSIDALNKIVALAAEREDQMGENSAKYAEQVEKVLEKIAEVAGDSLEDHVKAANRAKPRKARVYKDIVEEIAVHFCDDCLDDTDHAYAVAENVREVLARYGIQTVDFQGKVVKIV